MSGTDGCSFKAITKFCLLYFTTILVLTLIFTGVNSEPMNEEQTTWWWFFLGSLLATAAMSASALALLIYTDYTQVQPTMNNVDIEKFIQGKAPIMAEPSTSSSYKTILTINSQQTNDQDVQNTIKSPGTNFVNLTPKSSKTPTTTVVDVKAERMKTLNDMSRIPSTMQANNSPKSNMREPSNLGAIPTETLASTINEKGKKTKKNKKKKKQKTTT